MDRFKKFLFGTIIIISFIVFSSIFLFNEWSREETITTTTTTIRENLRIIETIDRDIEIISENPDLIFDDWLEFDDLIYNEIEIFLNSSSINIKNAKEKFFPWYGNGHYLVQHSTIERVKKGIIIMHPENRAKPCYLEQNIALGNDDYLLIVTMGNLADYFIPCDPCSDNIFKVKIKDLDNNSEEIIYEEIIRSDQGWQTRYLNISDYKNKKINFKIESHAGGICGTPDPSWCGEWGAVDEFYIVRLE